MKNLLAAWLFAPALAQQDTQRCPTEVAQHYCFDATCGVQLAEAALRDHLDCECTDSHIGFDVTNCDEETNTLSVFYFWKPPATCRGGLSFLKPPVHDIPCGTTCVAGQRFDVKTLKCEPCQKGQYSMAGGLSYDPPWTYLPPQFSADCVNGLVNGATSGLCNEWRTMDNYLDSGDNWEKANTENVLTFQIELVKEGRVVFEYKYDAEDNYDIFSLFVDGEKSFEARNPVLSWTETSVDLKKGFHTLRWVYKKDGSLSKGADKAFIRSIKVFGVRQFDAECLLCPPGRYSGENASEVCKVCPENTHSRSYGAVQCEPCHDWEKAFPGSATCSPRLPCTVNDYFEEPGPCVNGQRNVATVWIQPIKCETTSVTQGSEFMVGNGDNAVNFTKLMNVEFLQPFLEIPNNVTLEPIIAPWARQDRFELSALNISTTGFVLMVHRIMVPAGDQGWGEPLKVRWSARVQAGEPLPANRTEACLPPACLVGQQRAPDGGCMFCPKGRATGAVAGADCVECGKGEGARQYVAYANWSHLSVANTGCTGDCGTPGWRYSGAFIDSGAGHGVGGSSWFTEKLPEMPARVELDYLLSCPEGGGYLEVQIEKNIVFRILCEGCRTVAKSASVEIDAAIFEGKERDFVLKITYHKIALLSFQHSCDVAKMYKLAMFGAKSGIGGHMGGDGAVGCSKCDVGRFSTNAECVDCEAGSFQDNVGTDTCSYCPGGKFSYRSAMTACLDCGFHTTPNRERTSCDGSCMLAVNGTAYDLAPMFQREWVYPTYSKDNRFSYYFIMCDAPVPAECQRLKDDKWTEIPSDVTQPRPVHSCISRNGFDESGLPVVQSINAGAIVGYDQLDASRPLSFGTRPTPSDRRSGVSIKMDQGATTMCTLSDGQTTAQQPLITYLHFVCTPHRGSGDPVDVTPGKFSNASIIPPCVSHLEWKSSNACPLCISSDQYYFDSPCVADLELVKEAQKGKTTRKYFWVEPKTCVGGLALPDPNVTLGCEILEVVGGTHVVMSKGAVAALSIIGVLLALAGIAVVVCLIRKKRALERDNQNLRNYAQLAGDGKSATKIPDVVELHTGI
jgi:hypothetical protein